MKKVTALLLLALSCLWAGQVGAAAAFVQVGSATDYSGTASGNVILNGVTAGNTIIVACGGNSFSSTTTLTVNDGNAYTEIKGVAYNASTARHSIFALQNVTSGNKTIAITWNRTVFGHCIALEFSGLGTINTGTDVPISNTGNSATPTTGSTATLSQANMLIIASASGGDAVSWSAGTTPATSGYTSKYWEPATTIEQMSVDYKITSATTAQSAAWGTLAGADQWAAVLVMIPEAAAAGNAAWYYERRRN